MNNNTMDGGSGTATFGAKGSNSLAGRLSFPRVETEREKREREELMQIQDFFIREQQKDKKLLEQFLNSKLATSFRQIQMLPAVEKTQKTRN